MMNEGVNPVPKRLGRSVGAVFAGFGAGFVLSMGTDEILRLLKVYPPWGVTMTDGLFLIATTYRVLYNIMGCALTARLAPNKPMGHALVIGALGTVVGLAGAAATWNHLPSLGPHWYSVTIAAVSMPCAWFGGILHRVWSAKR